jgi:hypothetical protein
MPQTSKIILCIQGVYTTLTALWPIVHLKSFLIVTGPKTDIWLLNTVSLLLLAMGISFLIWSKEKSPSNGIRLLAINSAITLAAIDFYYTAHHIISRVYIVDGIMQLVFISWWLFHLFRKKS